MNAFLDARSNLCYTQINVEQDHHFGGDGRCAFGSSGGFHRAIMHPHQRVGAKSLSSQRAALTKPVARHLRRTKATPRSQPLAKSRFQLQTKRDFGRVTHGSFAEPGIWQLNDFLLSNAASDAHSPPTLALICIRLI